MSWDDTSQWFIGFMQDGECHTSDVSEAFAHSLRVVPLTLPSPGEIRAVNAQTNQVRILMSDTGDEVWVDLPPGAHEVCQLGVKVTALGFVGLTSYDFHYAEALARNKKHVPDCLGCA